MKPTLNTQTKREFASVRETGLKFLFEWAFEEQGTQGEHQNVDLESDSTKRTYLPKRHVLLLLILLTSQRPVPPNSGVFIKLSIRAFPDSRTSPPPRRRTRPMCSRRADTFTQRLQMRFALKELRLFKKTHPRIPHHLHLCLLSSFLPPHPKF